MPGMAVMLLILMALSWVQAAGAVAQVATIELLGQVPADGTFAADGAFIYLAEDRDLVILDTTYPSAPRAIGRVGPFSLPIRDVATDGPIVYVATGAPGQAGMLHILDAADPAMPQELAALGLPGDARGVTLGGGRAYVRYVAESRGTFGVQVFDVADPAQPSLAATWDPSDCRNGLAVLDTQVLCTWAARLEGGGLVVVDAADPQLAQPAGSLMVPGFAFGVAVEATHAYVAWTTGGPLSPTAPGGLRIVDMSDPVHPMEAGAVAAGPALDVVVRNGYAFLGTSYGGLRVIDVREPAAPVEVAAVQPSTNGDQIVRVRLSGDRLYALQAAR